MPLFLAVTGRLSDLRYLTPALIFVLALTIGVFSVYGGGSYAGLKSLKRSLVIQQRKNFEERRYIEGLQRQVSGIEQDARILEKTARNELGMARPDELIFIFDDEQDPKEKQP